ncbi:hypothetical protein EVAR_69644_1 [Eumeta japonica]|uniref:Uncharacterized protein n=1 Tax=Eumeta variegata TaxID=151549 RepID=A0A4C1SZC7_EUMVA|nr:hypothetical protein EVAR_69644_1 [Eumeta japonica]
MSFALRSTDTADTHAPPRPRARRIDTPFTQTWLCLLIKNTRAGRGKDCAATHAQDSEEIAQYLLFYSGVTSAVRRVLQFSARSAVKPKMGAQPCPPQPSRRGHA